MSITLNLPAGLEHRLRQSAEGDDQDGFRQLVADAVAPAVEAQLRKNTEASGLTTAQFKDLSQRLFQKFAAVNRRATALPATALTREGIYGDHD